MEQLSKQDWKPTNHSLSTLITKTNQFDSTQQNSTQPNSTKPNSIKPNKDHNMGSQTGLK